jgi:hypothetical protein
LLTELLLTRIFSVTLQYHLSFMVVSLAMLGLGASGFALTLLPARASLGGAPPQAAVAALALAFGITLAIATCFNVVVPFDPNAFKTEFGTTDLAPLPVVLLFVVCALPFFMGGVVVSLILAHDVASAHRLYGADLAGAAAGCVAFIPLTDALGAPNAVLVTAAIASVAAVVLASGRTMSRVAIAGCALLVAATLANPRLNFFDVRMAKGEREPPTMAREWNSFSRVDVPGVASEL